MHCEFDGPDLPWLFTPTDQDGDDHLPPWLRLVVVPEQLLGPPLGQGLPQQVTVPISELPPAGEAWAWAHAQVIGPAAGEPGIAGRLDPGNPALNLARLLCPRRLEPRRSYRAMLVPTFEAGRRAGLGQTPVKTLQWSWPDDGGDDTVQLPVYDSSWTFSTGDDGDFETLAKRLRPVAAPPGTGRRLVDTARPGLCLEPGGDGRPREVLGPLVRPAEAPSPVPDPAAAGVLEPGGGGGARGTAGRRRLARLRPRVRRGRPGTCPAALRGDSSGRRYGSGRRSAARLAAAAQPRPGPPDRRRARRRSRPDGRRGVDGLRLGPTPRRAGGQRGPPVDPVLPIPLQALPGAPRRPRR